MHAWPLLDCSFLFFLIEFLLAKKKNLVGFFIVGFVNFDERLGFLHKQRVLLSLSAFLDFV